MPVNRWNLINGLVCFDAVSSWIHWFKLTYLHKESNCNCIKGKDAKLITIVISSAVTCITAESGATVYSSITAITFTIYVSINYKCQAADYTGTNAVTTNLWINWLYRSFKSFKEKTVFTYCARLRTTSFLHYSDIVLHLRGFSKWGRLYPSAQNTKAGKGSGTTTMAWKQRLGGVGCHLLDKF